jgi:hypothetical protein
VPGFLNYIKGCTRLAAASDKVYQLLAHGLWFSPASSTTKTGCHDIAEILLKVALNTINQSINQNMLITDTQHCMRKLLWTALLDAWLFMQTSCSFPTLKKNDAYFSGTFLPCLSLIGWPFTGKLKSLYICVGKYVKNIVEAFQ